MRYFLMLSLAIISITAKGQILYPDSELLEYYRVLEVKNNNAEDRLSFFPSIVNQYDNDSLSWNVWGDNIQPKKLENNKVRLESFRFSNYYNTTYARGMNDGAIWRGKGLTSAIQGGASGKFGILEFTIAPILYYSQNKPFELADQTGNNNIYNYQFTNKRVDYVQRYGDGSFTKFNWGQTDIRVVYKSYTLGVSTQNLVMGPAQRNPIIMSNNASGVPRIDLGTHKPIKTKIGMFEGKVFWGIMQESDYYDDDSANDNRYWTAISLAYSPNFIKGLSFGFHRSFLKRGEEFGSNDIYKALWSYENKKDTLNVNDEYDQLASATLRWIFKEVGFETYVEYGKNDFGGNPFSTEPEHARAYTLGLSKYVDVKNNIVKLTYEHASLDKSRSTLYRGFNTWYSHHIVNHGYTQDGQVVGAGIGPGSTSDYFEAQYFFEQGRLQLSAQRTRFNDDYFIDNILDKNRHDHEWNVEGRYSRFVRGYLLGVEASYSYRDNIYYIEGNYKTNFFMGVTLSKQLY